MAYSMRNSRIMPQHDGGSTPRSQTGPPPNRRKKKNCAVTSFGNSGKEKVLLGGPSAPLGIPPLGATGACPCCSEQCGDCHSSRR
eukprot:6055100-Prymnesium_polylepis.1